VFVYPKSKPRNNAEQNNNANSQKNPSGPMPVGIKEISDLKPYQKYPKQNNDDIYHQIFKAAQEIFRELDNFKNKICNYSQSQNKIDNPNERIHIDKNNIFQKGKYKKKQDEQYIYGAPLYLILYHHAFNCLKLYIQRKSKTTIRESNRNIVLPDVEVKKTGGDRWDAKNQKKYVIQYAIVAVFAIIGVVAIIKYPSNLLPIIVVAIAMFASVLFTPARK
jgi:hypothetical protein